MGSRWASGSAPPELSRGQARAFHERLELRPGDLRMAHARAETAVRTGDHVLAADQPGVADDSLGDELGMLHEVAGVADHAGDEDLALRQLHVLPHAPLVLVARVGGLDRV